MSKRFTSTEKWDDPWYRKLSSKHKCIWQYLCDRCDNAGVWIADWDLISFYIGDSCLEDDFTVINNGKERIKKIRDDKYLIIDFVRYQWGKNQKVIIHVNDLLLKHKIDGVSIGYPYSIDAPKNKNKNKNKEKEKENDNCIYTIISQSQHDLILKSWNEFCDKIPNIVKIKELSNARKRKLTERLKQSSFIFEDILTAIAEQPFLFTPRESGEHKDWIVSFDWIILNDTNYLKTLERKYKDVKTNQLPESLKQFAKS